MSAVAEFFVVFVKSVGVFFQNVFIVLVQKGLHVVGATVANTYGMSVENTVKFVKWVFPKPICSVEKVNIPRSLYAVH